MLKLVVGAGRHGHRLVLLGPVQPAARGAHPGSGAPGLAARDQHGVHAAGLDVQARLVDQRLRHVAADAACTGSRRAWRPDALGQKQHRDSRYRHDSRLTMRTESTASSTRGSAAARAACSIRSTGSTAGSLVVLVDLAVADEHRCSWIKRHDEPFCGARVVAWADSSGSSWPRAVAAQVHAEQHAVGDQALGLVRRPGRGPRDRSAGCAPRASARAAGRPRGSVRYGAGWRLGWASARRTAGAPCRANTPRADELRIGQHVDRRFIGAGGHSGLLQRLGHVGLVTRRGPLGHRVVQIRFRRLGNSATPSTVAKAAALALPSAPRPRTTRRPPRTGRPRAPRRRRLTASPAARAASAT